MLPRLQVRSNATPLSKFSSLLERDESPAGAQSSLDAIVATPMAPPNTAIPEGRFGIPSSAIKTPQTASRIAFGEMHPSKIHQGITKSVGSLSSHPVNDIPQLSPSKSTIATVTQNTPSRARSSLSDHMNSPTFDFSFERPESDLSAEAQKIMESVREEAAKIKAQMLQERARQDHEDGETEQLYSVQGGKITKPKGKTGRFSDVHRQEFKKMNSIAGHASTWKNRLQGDITQSLKRSPSKAGLDESTTPKSMSKTKSMRALPYNTPDRLENASPGKRARRDYGDDISCARPVSRDTNDSTPNTPAMTRPSSNLPSVVTTPTKASLARSASVKNMKTSMIPSLSRPASSMTLGGRSLTIPKTEGNNKYAGSLSRFGGSMKSILHRAQPKFSHDPQKATAETHLPLPKANFSPEKDLPSLPSSPSKDLPPMQQSPTIKRVDFSDFTASRYPELAASPSMSKVARHQAQNPPSSPSKADPEAPVTYPLLASSPNITTRRPIPKPTTPGDFTFRADREIQFSPSKIRSPGSTTIRIVRPSGLPTPMHGIFDVKPSIPHGMSNKKRKHGVDDGEEILDKAHKLGEGSMEVWQGENEEGQHRAKRQRVHMTSSPSSVQAKENMQSPLKRRFGKGGKTPKKGAMTLARLSALARPKGHR